MNINNDEEEEEPSVCAHGGDCVYSDPQNQSTVAVIWPYVCDKSATGQGKESLHPSLMEFLIWLGENNTLGKETKRSTCEPELEGKFVPVVMRVVVVGLANSCVGVDSGWSWSPLEVNHATEGIRSLDLVS